MKLMLSEAKQQYIHFTEVFSFDKRLLWPSSACSSSKAPDVDALGPVCPTGASPLSVRCPWVLKALWQWELISSSPGGRPAENPPSFPILPSPTVILISRLLPLPLPLLLLPTSDLSIPLHSLSASPSSLFVWPTRGQTDSSAPLSVQQLSCWLHLIWIDCFSFGGYCTPPPSRLPHPFTPTHASVSARQGSKVRGGVLLCCLHGAFARICVVSVVQAQF